MRKALLSTVVGLSLAGGLAGSGTPAQAGLEEELDEMSEEIVAERELETESGERKMEELVETISEERERESEAAC